MTRSFLTKVQRRAFGGVSALMLAATAMPAIAEADLAAAQAIIDAHKLLPTFQAPGKPFDARACMADKKILSIPASSSIPFAAGIGVGMEATAKEIGFELRVWQNQGQPTQWVQGVEYAIANGYDAVDVMAGIDPNTLAPQLKAAKDAGLKVYATHHRDVADDTVDQNTDVSLPLDYSGVGEIIAAWIVVETKGIPAELDKGYGDAHVPGYRALWGLE